MEWLFCFWGPRPAKLAAAMLRRSLFARPFSPAGFGLALRATAAQRWACSTFVFQLILSASAFCLSLLSGRPRFARPASICPRPPTPLRDSLRESLRGVWAIKIFLPKSSRWVVVPLPMGIVSLPLIFCGLAGGEAAEKGRRPVAEGWTAVARRARPSRLWRRRAERIASCETARPARRAGQPHNNLVIAKSVGCILIHS